MDSNVLITKLQHSVYRPYKHFTMLDFSKFLLLAVLVCSASSQSTEQMQLPVECLIKDSPTPKIQMVEPDNNEVFFSPIFNIELKTEDFLVDSAGAQALPVNYSNGVRRNNAGHYHAYVSQRNQVTGFNEVVFFLGASDQLVRTIDLTNAGKGCGEYNIVVELEHDDHTRRVKAGPRDYPPIDSKTVFVLCKKQGRAKKVMKLLSYLKTLLG
eukprot:m.12217 g.12217  ORF g.12217 m.12217 type:complete len:212 (+) comp4614_c0_seq2:141-776(+)